MSFDFQISIADDIDRLRKSLTALERDQLPFATAKALTALAKTAQAAEKEAMPEVFDRPTPFTVNSVAVKSARKSDLEARVFIKDVAAAYLAPFEFGGNHTMIGAGKTWLNPKDRTLLNQYGNLPRNLMRRLTANPNVFVGSVTFRKSGETVSGIWERPKTGGRLGVRGQHRKRRGTKGNTKNVVGGVRTGLKLLVRFGDARPVRQHLEFGDRAFEVVDDHFDREFEAALGDAVSTAKL